MEIKIVNGDITKFPGDAIVNAANEVMLGGGGVDGSIHRAAGSDLVKWIRAHVQPDERGTRVATGKAVVTPSFQLPCHWIIHTAGPIFEQKFTRGMSGSEQEVGHKLGMALLVSSIYESLVMAENYGCMSVAIPAISCGVYGATIPDFVMALRTAIGSNPKGWQMDSLHVYLFLESEFQTFTQEWENPRWTPPMRTTADSIADAHPISQSNKLGFTFVVGEKVRTVAIDNPPTDWANPGSREFGVTGRVIGESWGHGLCYQVQHGETTGWYDPRELEEV